MEDTLLNELNPEHLKPEPHLAPVAKTKSKGEKFFDRFVYGGIAGVGTFLVTLGVALSIKHGRGKGHYMRAVDWMERKLNRIMPGVAGRKFSEEFVQTMKALKKFVETSNQHTPYLLRKAQRIEEYLNQR